MSIALPVKKFPGIKLREHCQIGVYSVEIILQPNFAAQVEFFGIFKLDNYFQINAFIHISYGYWTNLNLQPNKFDFAA